MWASSNDSIMNHCMANIERLRRFFSSYSKFVVIGSINTLQLQELLATNLLFSSKPVAWMTGGVYSRLLTRDKEDVLESFVHDQGSPNHLVVILSDSQNCREVERAVQFCAENFYPCLIISRLPPPTTEQSETVKAQLHDFSFPSRVHGVLIGPATNSQFDFAATFLISQVFAQVSDDFRMTVER